MNGRRTIWLSSLGTMAAIVSACAAPASRYPTDAAAFIASDEVYDAYKVDFENIDCGEPASTDVGTTLSCTADGKGQRYRLTFTIVGKNRLELSGIELLDAPPSSQVTGSSEPPTSTPTESTSGAPTTAASGGPTGTAAVPAPAVTTAAPTTAAPTTAAPPATTAAPTTAAPAPTTAAPTTAAPAG